MVSLAGQSMKKTVMSLEVKALVAPPKESTILVISFSPRRKVEPPARRVRGRGSCPAPRFLPS